jgi:hypothetical protein
MEKFEEKKTTPFILDKLSISNKGAPILMPRALASEVLEIAQPSLFDKTTIGLEFNSGRIILSHEQ